MSKLSNQNLSLFQQKLANFNFVSFLQKNVLLFLLLAGMVLFAYGNSFFNNFTSDDWGIFKSDYSWQYNMPNFWSIMSNYPETFHRLVLLKLGLSSPIFFRLPNILSHLFSVWTVFLLIYLMKNKKTAFFSSALFAVHPLLSEAIGWISGSPYVKSSFFLLFSFFLYLYSSKIKRLYYISLLFFYFSLLFSEKIIPLFLIFLLWEICYGNLTKNWLNTLPFFFLSVFKFIYLFPMISSREKNLLIQFNQEKVFYDPFIQIPVALTSYFELIFWPDKLTLYHSELIFTPLSIMLRSFLTLGGFILMIIFFLKNKYLFFWSAFILIALLATLTPFGLSWVVAERYVYLSSIGIFAVISCILSYLSRQKNSAPIISLVFTFFIFILSLRTIIRNFDWKNDDQLWLSAVRTSPNSYQNHNNLGDYYGRNKDTNRAIAEYQEAIRLKPNYGAAHHNLGNAYLEKKDIKKAIESYQKAIHFNPLLWQSYQNLAGIYYKQKNLKETVANLEKSYKINPNPEVLETINQLKKIQP